MRRPSWQTLGFIPLYASGALADFAVGTYPAPRDFTSNSSLIAQGWNNLTKTLDSKLKLKANTTATQVLAGLEDVTFGVGMFSLHDPDATKLQYHYTAPEVRNATAGTHKADEDTIYRIASVSKLVTVFAGMINLSEEDWNKPLTEINPAFKEQAQSIAQPEGIATSDPIWRISWDKITPWALASQLSGIPTIGVPLGDVYSPLNFTDYGTPPVVNITSWSPCANRLIKNVADQYCDAPDSIDAVKDLPPNFLPWSTPVYSDLNYMLLAVAISNITGKPMTDLYQDSILKPLGMNDTSDTHPTEMAKIKRSVIVGDPILNWVVEPGFTTPSGGLLSTVSDLQKLGFAMVNNTLLSPAATRKWMKPQSHTASLSYLIGAPWEIHRVVSPDTGKVTELYTKLGDSGEYGGTLVIIPEYDAGFTLLNGASTPLRSTIILATLDVITTTILPALEAEASAQARRNFVGTYKFSDESIDVQVTIGYNKSTLTSVKSDLMVTKFNFNGTDVIQGPFFRGTNPRLERSIDDSKQGSSGSIAFELTSPSVAQTSTYMEAMQHPDKLPVPVIGSWTGFYYSDGDFVFTDSQRWGGISFDMMVFNVDKNGKATECIPGVDRIKLKRTS